MATPEAAVRIKAADGQWLTLGRDPLQGIVPQGITLSANQSGPDTCGFTLRRRADVLWPDLLAFNQCEIEIGNSVVWGGRTWEAPLADGGEYAIGVQGRGWQYHLDDDLLSKFYVHTTLTDWRSQRSFAGASLATFVAGAEPSAADGVSIIGFPNASVVPNNSASGITLDLGSGRTAKRIVVVWGTVNGNAAFTNYVRTHDTESPLTGTTADALAVANETIAASPSTTTSAGTFSTGQRYVSIFMYRDDGGSGAVSADHLTRIHSVFVFSATAYESGNASILKASDVVKDVLASGALPLLSSATDLIQSTSFSIPHFAPDGYQTPRQLISAANAYETSTFGVNAVRKLFYRPLEVTPTIEVGQWSGSEFRDATSNSADGLYNKVIVQGTGPGGEAISEARTATSGLLTRQGFTRTATLNIGGSVTTTGAQQLGDIWLSERSSPPFKGSLTINGFGGARLSNGSGINPHELLLHFGKRIRLGHLVDPATGGWGRDGMIASVTYNHDENTASVEIDNERGRFEALLSRLAVVVGQITI